MQRSNGGLGSRAKTKDQALRVSSLLSHSLALT